MKPAGFWLALLAALAALAAAKTVSVEVNARGSVDGDGHKDELTLLPPETRKLDEEDDLPAPRALCEDCFEDMKKWLYSVDSAYPGNYADALLEEGWETLGDLIERDVDLNAIGCRGIHAELWADAIVELRRVAKLADNGIDDISWEMIEPYLLEGWEESLPPLAEDDLAGPVEDFDDERQLEEHAPDVAAVDDDLAVEEGDAGLAFDELPLADELAEDAASAAEDDEESAPTSQQAEAEMARQMELDRRLAREYAREESELNTSMGEESSMLGDLGSADDGLDAADAGLPLAEDSDLLDAA